MPSVPTRRVAFLSAVPFGDLAQNAAPPSVNAARPSVRPSVGPRRHVIRLSQRRSEDIITQKPFKSCRVCRRRDDGDDGNGGRHRADGRASRARRQQLQGHFITGFGDRIGSWFTARGRARSRNEHGARRPSEWAVGQWLHHCGGAYRGGHWQWQQKSGRRSRQ